MSDSDFREAGRSLYILSKVSGKKFEASITEMGGMNNRYFYTFPLDRKPYHAVIARRDKTHLIGLGKDTEFGLAVYISFISLDCEEGRSMRKDVLDGVNDFIDYVHGELPRRASTTAFEMRNIGTRQVREMVLKVIDGNNLSEVLSKLNFSGKAKKKAIKEVEKLQKDGTVEFKDGKFGRLKL